MRKILDKCGVNNILNMALGILFMMMIFVLLLGSFRARANERTIEKMEKERSAIVSELSAKDAQLLAMSEEISQLKALNGQSIKQYIDSNDMYEREIKRLKKKLEKAKQKKKEVQIKYQTVKGYLTKDEIWLANYIAKGGTVTDAGIWYCTAYCTEKRKHICGTGKGITASGEPVEAFVSVALNKHDLKQYPFGTKLYIEGIGVRTVMDTGGDVRQKQIDCAVDTHYNAVHWSGQGDHRVWVLKEGDK